MPQLPQDGFIIEHKPFPVCFTQLTCDTGLWGQMLAEYTKGGGVSSSEASPVHLLLQFQSGNFHSRLQFCHFSAKRSSRQLDKWQQNWQMSRMEVPEEQVKTKSSPSQFDSPDHSSALRVIYQHTLRPFFALFFSLGILIRQFVPLSTSVANRLY